jgi:hypothetical protein
VELAGSIGQVWQLCWRVCLEEPQIFGIASADCSVRQPSPLTAEPVSKPTGNRPADSDGTTELAPSRQQQPPGHNL